MAKQNKLPPYCFTVSPYTGTAVRIVRGESTLFGIRGREAAADLNRALGVTKQQESAMKGGVAHGWSSPWADPDNYNAAGQYVGPAEQED